MTTLNDDLLKAMKDTRFTDMVFVCSDGEEVPALRKLVAARSPVLQSMLLTADMVESRQTRVPLPSMSGAIMRLCLEFLYTDTVEGITLWYLPLHQVLELAAAARFFLVPGLEKLCVDFCVSKAVWHPIPEVFKAYNAAAMLFHDQPHQSLALLLGKLNQPIEAALNETLDSYRQLSECGCLHFLTNQEPALGEYHVLVHAIKWCAHSTVFMSHPSVRSMGVRNVFNKLFPPVSEANLLAMLAEGGLAPTSSAADDLDYVKLLAEPVVSLLKKASLDLSKIPFLILSSIFEPLEIIPSSMLLAAYKAQASLNKPHLRWDGWCLHQNYVISSSDPSQVSCTEGNVGIGFARCCMCVMACDYLFFEWEVIFLEKCMDYCIGFCLANPPKESYDVEPSFVGYLGYKKETVALVSAEGCICHNGNVVSEAKPACDVFERDRGCSGTAFGVHIQLQTGLCTFKINGKKIGEAVIAGVDKGVYPAIAMRRLGKARIRVVSHGPISKRHALTP